VAPLRLDPDKLDLLLTDGLFYAVQGAEKIEVPPATTKLTVGDRA
jgi:hypothetical protein